MRLHHNPPALLVLCALWVTPAPAQSPTRVNVPVADEIEATPVLIVHHSGTQRDKLRDREMLGQLSRRVIVAAWEDGTVVWSEDSIRGGEPYFTAQLDPQRVAGTISEMCEASKALPESSHTAQYGPESSYNTITVHSDVCFINWLTWHEVYEAHGRMVAVDGVLRILPEGREAEEFRRERSSAEYLLFIDTWRKAKETALSLIPADSAERTPAPVTFRANWVPLDMEPEEIASDPDERERLAAEAVDRLTEDVVNIYLSEWSELPEPEFITQLLAAIAEGRYAEHDWMAARAQEVALRRLQSHPEIVYPLFVQALEDPHASHVLGRSALALPSGYQVAALADIRALIERDAFLAQKEEFLHAALIGRADRHEPFWLDFAEERFRDEGTPLNARIAAGAAVYGTMEPGAMLADVQNADEASREAARGALARLIAQLQGIVPLGSKENALAARSSILEALKSENQEVRKWAAEAVSHIALLFREDDTDADILKAFHAIIAARNAEQDWQIRATLEQASRKLQSMMGFD